MANFLTLLRIVIVPPTAIFILREEYTPALVLIVLGALSDLLDGKVARRQGSDNGLGKILDPLADKVFILSILIAFVDVQKVSSIPVILLLFRELSLTLLRSSAITQGNLLGASPLGKLKTSLQFLSLMLLTVEQQAGNLLLWCSVGVAYLSLYDYLKSYLRNPSGLNYP